MTAFPSGVSTSVQPSFVPSPTVPAGLTLRNTYTTSQVGLTFPRDWIFIVAAGAGGNGQAATTTPTGGGGGACFQGWIRATDAYNIVIGASPGGSTVFQNAAGISTLTVPGGGTGHTGTLATPRAPGAGHGGLTSTSTTAPETINRTAFGMFHGGPPASFSVAGCTSGNGTAAATASTGNGGPGGGSGSAQGGASVSPNGTIYTGGTAAVAGLGGGGAGILGNGNSSVGTSGGAGGIGGGGGGGANTTTVPGSTAGAGGQGAVLIYY